MNKNQKIKAKIGILAACAVSLSYMGFAPIIATIAGAFPDTDISLIQMILTLPNLMFIFFSPLSGTLMLHFRKKNLMLISVLLYIVGGILPFFVHSSVWWLLTGSVLIGSGSGLLMPVINGVICDNFELEERGTLMGLNATCVALGALFFIFVSGALSSKGWHFSYLVFVLLIPILFIVYFCVPKGEVPVPDKEGKRGGLELNPLVIFLFSVGFIYFILQNAFNTNSSLIVEEYGFVGGNIASAVSMGNTIGGMVGGMLFGLLLSKFKDQIETMAVGMAAVGFLAAYFLHSFFPVLAGSAMVGFGFAVFSAAGTFLLSKYLKPENNAFTLAIYSAFINAGAAISPYVVNGISGLFGKTVGVRFLFCGICLVVLTVVLSIGLAGKKQQ